MRLMRTIWGGTRGVFGGAGAAAVAAAAAGVGEDRCAGRGTGRGLGIMGMAVVVVEFKAVEWSVKGKAEVKESGVQDFM